MCTTCGCGEPGNEVTFRKPGEENLDNIGHQHVHSHEHNHDGHQHSHDHTHSHGDEHNHNHSHDHANTHSHSREIEVEMDILGKNNLLAERNRGYFEAKNILALNLVSSPGSGKTSLLEKTIGDLKNEIKFYVIEGDQQTMNDANRIDKAGAPVIQVNTGNGCHLDSDMVNKAVKELKPEDNSVMMIENVGNLVCPSLFDLGEAARVVVISVTEGDDKPLKYPTMFESSDICIINKMDLLPYVDFDVEKAKQFALQVNHHLRFFEVSVKTGEGMDDWYAWLKNEIG
ncbi:MAG: hydrogenase accessory protein HypB [Bacteroidetes bacterium]|nr:MAG: hydrogenase accessory protein HypB [Bacteroidota bacterium]